MERRKTAVGQTRKQKFLSWFIFCLAMIIFIGYPVLNWYNKEHPVSRECIIESAEVFNSSSGTGGIATSGTELKINTDGCGTVYVDHAIAPQKKSYQDMADELNQHQGQKITLIFPPFQLPGTRDSVLTGYGYRL